MEWILVFLTYKDPWIVFVLFLLGIVGFIISTLAGGGGALVLLPMVNSILGAQYAAPVLNLGNLIGRPSRLVIYWKHIHWRICMFYVVPALLGAWAGAWMFGQLRIEFLQLIIGGFLVSTLFQYRMGKRARSFNMPEAGFAPLGFIIAFLGTLVGAMGPVLNPFYMNAGLEKEELIGTKTANSFFMGLGQLGGYSFFGLLEGAYWGYGIALGAGAILGNIIGKQILSRITVSGFRILLLIFMVLSGGMLIYASLMSLLG